MKIYFYYPIPFDHIRIISQNPTLNSITIEDPGQKNKFLV